MQQEIVDNLQKIERICERFSVLKLDVFGSAVTGPFNAESSDIDFLVTFNDSEDSGLQHPYFGLHGALRDLFQRDVDLVMDSAIRNPYFRAEVDETRVSLYAA